jgi:hypothetical protein
VHDGVGRIVGRAGLAVLARAGLAATAATAAARRPLAGRGVVIVLAVGVGLLAVLGRLG